MHVTVVFRPLAPSDGLRAYAERKLVRLGRVVGEGAEARVVLTVDKFRHRAEVTLSARRLAAAGAEETDDMYAAIDLVVDKLERQAAEARDRQRAQRRGDEA